MFPRFVLLGLLLVARPALAQSDPTAPAPRADRLVDMVVAEVGTTVVTLSELVAQTRLVLLRTRGPDIAWSADITPPLLSAVLESIVNRELLLAEVKRLQLRDPDPAVLERAATQLAARFATPGDFDRFLERAGFRDIGADSSEMPPALVAILKAELLAERFLDVRVRLNAQASVEEITACYEKNRGRFDGRPITEVQGRIGQRIREQKEQRALELLIEQLEERTPIVYLPPFERRTAPVAVETLGLSCLP